MKMADSPSARRNVGLHTKRNGLKFTAMLVKQVIFILISISALLPIYFMITTAFKSQSEYLAHPFSLVFHWSFANFSQAFQAGFAVWFRNTLLIGAFSVILVTILASFAGFAFAWLYNRPPRLMTTFSAILMMVPPIVMLIPLYQTASWLHQTNTYQAVILVYAGLMMPFSTYMLTSFFRTIPKDAIEAALIDGAGPIKIYGSIILPLSVSSLLTLGVVNLLWVWNELLIALTFLQSDSTRTLMVGISMFQSKSNLNVPLTMAGLVIATVPIVIFYLFSQKYFVRGLTMGTVK